MGQCTSTPTKTVTNLPASVLGYTFKYGPFFLCACIIACRKRDCEDDHARMAQRKELAWAGVHAFSIPAVETYGEKATV